MKHEIDIFLCDKKITHMMNACDLGFDGKFWGEWATMEFKTELPLSEKLFFKIMNVTKDAETYIAAILYAGIVYPQKGVKCLSDGKKELFIGI